MARTKITAHVVYRRALWALSGASWVGSMVAAMLMLSLGVRVDWMVIAEWTELVLMLSIGAMIVQVMPSAEAIAARAMAAAMDDMRDELAERRAREG